jgi:hypothetical protein
MEKPLNLALKTFIFSDHTIKKITNWTKNKHIKLLEEILRVQRYKDYGAFSKKNSGQGQLFNKVQENISTGNVTAECIAVERIVVKKG